MKVVHVCNTDIRGGAARAAFALSEALNQIGVDSKMLVQRKFGNSTNVYTVSDNTIREQFTNLRMVLDLAPMYLYTDRDKGRFSFGNVGLNIVTEKIIQDADIIHLHWINEGFLSLKSINKLQKLNKPIIWTFHDMWAFTGGCHYSSGCKNFESICSSCPYLKNPDIIDLSTKNWKEKNKIFSKDNLKVITCSKWLAEIAKTSSLFKDFDITPVPNTLSIHVYKPLDKSLIRTKYELPDNKFLILFGTINTKDKRKGFLYLKKSLLFLQTHYPDTLSKIELLVFGSSSAEELKDISYKTTYLGRTEDEYKLAEYYSAADVFVAPSLEDNLPNTIMESLSCGVPVVSFNIGGIPEMVDHLVNGYLAHERSVEDMAKGIYWIYENLEISQKLRENARNKVETSFSPSIIGLKHSNLYKQYLPEFYGT